MMRVFQMGDTTIRYPLDESVGRIGLELFPSETKSSLVPRRSLSDPARTDAFANIPPAPDYTADSLAHVKIVGDPYPGAFAQGRTMRNAPAMNRFKFSDQKVRTDQSRTIITTTLHAPAGYRIEHELSWHDGDAAAHVTTTFFNESSKPVVLEMLSSFSLGGITPFDAADAPNRLRVHRFRSGWCAEGRLISQTIEQLHLERSWHGSAVYSERFGQVGSMPARGWFPFLAIEDTVAGVVWAAQLAWAGSWQMEIYRQFDEVCISGGLADREFGHWTKTIQPGESLHTPTVTIACAKGTLDDVCDRLTALQQRPLETQPKIEQDLPIIFNEWCTTWGNPSHERMVSLAKSLKGTPTKYLVIDAGWYKAEGTTDWFHAHGDWIASPKLFPQGLAATAAAIREHGLIPGLWFEMETCGEQSTAFSLGDHFLKRDGLPITVRARHFWNLRDPAALDYLTHHVIDFLEQCGFGYVKIDYNETIGIGCDHPDSLGEGLRLQIEGIYRFFDRIRQRLPDLVIENCSSGGHRLEPSMLAKAAMASFSDAHETREIPIIAASLHRLILPRQSQIWAVLRPSHPDHRIDYMLAGTFLGRMCLSGDLDRLTPPQMELVRQAQELYLKAAPIIKHGNSRRFGTLGESWRYPQGWQGVLRVASDGASALAVVHSFEGSPRQLDIPLPLGTWRIAGQFPRDKIATVNDGNLACPMDCNFDGRVVLLSR